jgi:transketolase C-terminal domain/subunit
VTNQILFDRLAYVDRLKAGSFSEQQARAAADALGEALVETVATKADIVSVKADIGQLETKFEARFASVEARIAESRASIIQWVVGVAIAACTIGAAVASFVFKHMP